MEQAFCFRLDSLTQDETALAEACAAAQRKEFRMNATAADVKVLSMANRRTVDQIEGRTCVLLCRGRQTAQGMCAYVEPTFVPGGVQWPDCPEDVSAVEGTWPGNDHSVDIHSYYIRFSGDSGGWLDVVTQARAGDCVITKPVSVKAAHNWAEHAKRFDPDVFLAGIMEP